ncbi:hydroxypyruvate isomerase family protein [Derxia gummosa]|uniref:Hydroxypyruvate isomerase family protein n=1 Tax=Derxia gummosa DSM 723 TaxID=1121388 RepID=A0A8B6X681_9BURK|nr:TIM barrel protein [Derxia gummosa]
MLKYAANLSYLYTELPLVDRFAAAAADGFRYVELHEPYSRLAAELRNAALQAHVQTVLHNTAFGDFAAGERGLAAVPGREADFEKHLHEAFVYSSQLGNRLIHVLAGVADNGSSAARATYLRNLALAATEAAKRGLTILIEPINTRDMPGYFLNTIEQAADIQDAVGQANLKILFDCYHVQIMQGDLVRRFERFRERIGHVQIASVPERHEPDTGEVNYRYVLSAVAVSGYDDYIGCEYRPLRDVHGGTTAGLGWRHTVAP